MNTISDYTLFCTEEQIKKALELGAPLEVVTYHSSWGIELATRGKRRNEYILVDNFQQPEDYRCKVITIPTAEQMIGWLEGQGDIKSINVDCAYKWIYEIYNKEHWEIMKHNDIYKSRKEATLAAIDAALDYLIKNKK